MDNVKITLLYLVRKKLQVWRKRFYFKQRFRLSEILDFFADNLWKVLPEEKRKPVYDFLNKLIDRILWL